MKRKLLTGIMSCACVLALTAGSVVAEAYTSELTGLPIDDSLRDQRPVAAIVDNETLAYPHYGIAESDIVYELVNSTANGHITRLMVMYKDYNNVERIGNIRSARPTNILLASEYNAIICHDGGPFYCDQYFAADYAREHLSGGFTRIPNGKPTEFTEYIVAGEIAKRLETSGFSVNYNGHAQETTSHFNFAAEGSEAVLSGDVKEVSTVVLPFEHTNSTLKYNPDTQSYDYYCYGELHKDGEDDQVLTFKNVIIQDSTWTQLDENGYMIYNCIDKGRRGYYLTNGQCMPITWNKDGETLVTRYYDEQGNEIEVNRGKTYITLVPDDKWDGIRME